MYHVFVELIGVLLHKVTTIGRLHIPFWRLHHCQVRPYSPLRDADVLNGIMAFSLLHESVYTYGPLSCVQLVMAATVNFFLLLISLESDGWS